VQGVKLDSPGCSVQDSEGFEVRCEVPEGSGFGLVWTLTSTTHTSDSVTASQFTTSYAAPTVSSFALSGLPQPLNAGNTWLPT